MGEAFLCKFKFLVTQQKTEIYQDPNDRFLYKSRPVLDSQGNPVMEEVEKEKTFVVKLMRHDAEIRVQREAEIFTTRRSASSARPRYSPRPRRRSRAWTRRGRASSSST